MDFETGAFLTRWSVRAAIACWAVRVLVDTRRWRTGRSGADALLRFSRVSWTTGAACYVAHVLLAFAVYHGWSHTAAYEHTAERTFAATGLRWGGGLWLNHGVTLWWISDVAVWWRRGLDFPDRVPRYMRLLHGLFGFMVFNATVVFGPPVWRWVGLVFAVGMGLVFVWGRGPGRES